MNKLGKAYGGTAKYDGVHVKGVLASGTLSKSPVFSKSRFPAFLSVWGRRSPYFPGLKMPANWIQVAGIVLELGWSCHPGFGVFPRVLVQPSNLNSPGCWVNQLHSLALEMTALTDPAVWNHVLTCSRHG